MTKVKGQSRRNQKEEKSKLQLKLQKSISPMLKLLKICSLSQWIKWSLTIRAEIKAWDKILVVTLQVQKQTYLTIRRILCITVKEMAWCLKVEVQNLIANLIVVPMMFSQYKLLIHIKKEGLSLQKLPDKIKCISHKVLVKFMKTPWQMKVINLKTHILNIV